MNCVRIQEILKEHVGDEYFGELQVGIYDSGASTRKTPVQAMDISQLKAISAQGATLITIQEPWTMHGGMENGYHPQKGLFKLKQGFSILTTHLFDSEQELRSLFVKYIPLGKDIHEIKAKMDELDKMDNLDRKNYEFAMVTAENIINTSPEITEAINVIKKRIQGTKVATERFDGSVAEVPIGNIISHLEISSLVAKLGQMQMYSALARNVT